MFRVIFWTIEGVDTRTGSGKRQRCARVAWTRFSVSLFYDSRLQGPEGSLSCVLPSSAEQKVKYCKKNWRVKVGRYVMAHDMGLQGHMTRRAV